MSKTPPVASTIPNVTKHHDDTLTDNYHWLRDHGWPKVTDERVIGYLNEENAYYHEVMDPLKANEDNLYQEILGKIKLDDSSVPVKKDNYFYYTRMEKNSNHAIVCRKKDTLDSPEEIILNVNELAKQSKFFNVEAMAVSPDHNMLAYSYDTSGAERFVVVVKDLRDGSLLTDTIPDVLGDIVWHKNNKGFFYAKLNDNWRTDRIFYHELNTDPKNDKMIFHEEDNKYRVDVSKSASERFVFIVSHAKDNNETWFIDMTAEDLTPKLITKRKDHHLYNVDHHGDNFYILTNDLGKNFRFVSTLITHPEQAAWQEIIPHSSQSYLTRFNLYRDNYVVQSKEGGLTKIKIFSFAGQHPPKTIDFPDPTYQASSVFTNFNDESARIQYSSLNTPDTTYGFDFAARQLKTLKVKEVPAGFDHDAYQSQRIFATSPDGTEVPISLVYKKSAFKGDGSNPLYLYGYGSYGVSIPAGFKPQIIPLLDRGFVFAIAHIRGGDEMGYEWYENAKFLTKKRTFEDFIASAEHLIKTNYTSKGNIVIVGRSAGGMLIGVTVNERPDLFKAAVADVPFVDVLNTMLDESLPLTPPEFKEWGNPKEKDFYHYIKSYSPYDNVKAQNYPHMYVSAGISDPRVTYWEPAKWVAKLREYKTDENLLLLETNMDAGHAGASGRFGLYRDIAKEYNFILKVFGL